MSEDDGIRRVTKEDCLLRITAFLFAFTEGAKECYSPSPMSLMTAVLVEIQIPQFVSCFYCLEFACKAAGYTTEYKSH